MLGPVSCAVRGGGPACPVLFPGRFPRHGFLTSALPNGTSGTKKRTSDPRGVPSRRRRRNKMFCGGARRRFSRAASAAAGHAGVVSIDTRTWGNHMPHLSLCQSRSDTYHCPSPSSLNGRTVGRGGRPADSPPKFDVGVRLESAETSQQLRRSQRDRWLPAGSPDRIFARCNNDMVLLASTRWRKTQTSCLPDRRARARSGAPPTGYESRRHRDFVVASTAARRSFWHQPHRLTPFVAWTPPSLIDQVSPGFPLTATRARYHGDLSRTAWERPIWLPSSRGNRNETVNFLHAPGHEERAFSNAGVSQSQVRGLRGGGISGRCSSIPQLGRSRANRGNSAKIFANYPGRA